MNDPVIIEELDKMPIDNAEEMNCDDEMLEADDETCFNNEEVYIGLKYL